VIESAIQVRTREIDVREEWDEEERGKKRQNECKAESDVLGGACSGYVSHA
jgi:hypothetical protein